MWNHLLASARQMIYMKYQTILFLKKKKNNKKEGLLECRNFE